jgi:hypothetical protein
MSLRIISENNPDKDVSLNDFSRQEIDAAGKGVRPEVVSMFSPEVEKMLRQQKRANAYAEMQRKDPSLQIIRHETTQAIDAFQQAFEEVSSDAKKKNPELSLHTEPDKRTMIPAVV